MFHLYAECARPERPQLTMRDPAAPAFKQSHSPAGTVSKRRSELLLCFIHIDLTSSDPNHELRSVSQERRDPSPGFQEEPPIPLSASVSIIPHSSPLRSFWSPKEP